MTEHKSEQMMQTCLANEWKAQVVPAIPMSGNPEEFVWTLYALRNKETLQVVWVGNKLDGATYTYGDHKLILNWRNQVIKIITGKPDPRKLKGTSVESLEKIRNVPWVHDTPAIEVMLSVIRKDITWVRSFDKEICTAMVDVNLNEKGSVRHFHVKESPPNSGKRILEWADNYGFHAVRLDSIIDVS